MPRQAGTADWPLYPECPVTRSFHLPVGGPHRIFVELAGAEAGLPVVLCHGGPGGPADPHERRFFDPARFRIIAFDQRGAHRSEPLGELRDNTLDHLVADMAALRRHLGIGRWIVFGGSFGSALALHYAETHPDTCLALILHAVTTARPGFELWDFEASRELCPESWRAMAEAMPGPAARPLAERCFAAILAGGSDGEQAMRAWYRHSAVLSNVSPEILTPPPSDGAPDTWAAAARLSAHYWQHRLFVPPGSLLERAGRLAGLPGTIVHGLADRNTLVADARALHRCWPGSSLVEVPGAGHSPFEPGMAAALRCAVDACLDGRGG